MMLMNNMALEIKFFIFNRDLTDFPIRKRIALTSTEGIHEVQRSPLSFAYFSNTFSVQITTE